MQYYMKKCHGAIPNQCQNYCDHTGNRIWRKLGIGACGNCIGYNYWLSICHSCYWWRTGLLLAEDELLCVPLLFLVLSGCSPAIYLPGSSNLERFSLQLHIVSICRNNDQQCWHHIELTGFFVCVLLQDFFFFLENVLLKYFNEYHIGFVCSA